MQKRMLWRMRSKQGRLISGEEDQSGLEGSGSPAFSLCK